MTTLIQFLIIWITIINTILFLFGGFESSIENDKYVESILWFIITIIFWLLFASIPEEQILKLSGANKINNFIKTLLK